MKTKKWYQSKTMWLQIVSGIISLLTLLDGNLLTTFGLSDIMKEKILSIVVLVVSIGTIILRTGVQSPVSTLPSGTSITPNDVNKTIAQLKNK